MGNNIVLPGRKEKFNICRVDNLIIVNLHPCVGKADTTNLYPWIRSDLSPGSALLNLVKEITKQQKLSQAGVVVDRIELLASLLGTESTLKFIKEIRHSSAEQGLYPFFGHVDFALAPKSGHFQSKL